MGNSGRIAMGVGIIIAALFVLFGIIQITTGGVSFKTGFGGKNIAASGNYVTKSFNYEDFDKVELSGTWDAEVTSDLDYDVTVRIPENFENKIRVEKEGSTLVLGITPGFSFRSGKMEAALTMPEFSKAVMSGGTKFTFNGFQGDRLILKSSGGTKLEGKKCVYESLQLDASGAVSVDLLKSEFTSADVRISGAGSVKINMAGGKITGNISGAGSLKYTGEVSNVDIDESGLASVKRLE